MAEFDAGVGGGNYKGLDPVLAKVAKGKITSMKRALDTASKTADRNLDSAIKVAFQGKTQTGQMANFVKRINDELQKLYKYLDGNESNFAKLFDEAIASYQTSEANVAASYQNAEFSSADTNVDMEQ